MAFSLSGLVQGAKNLVSPKSLFGTTARLAIGDSVGDALEKGLSRRGKAIVSIGTGLAGLLSNPGQASGDRLTAVGRQLLDSFIGNPIQGSPMGDLATPMYSRPAGPPAPPSTSRSSATVVSPSALLGPQAPTMQRSAGRAFVPTPPTAQNPSITAPVSSVPSSGVPSSASAFITNQSFAPSPAPSFAAAVPFAAILRALAAAPGRSVPAGYVATPETLPLGSAPRRRLPDDKDRIPLIDS